MDGQRPKGRRVLGPGLHYFLLVGAVLGAAASVACGASADIGFARKGPFEACLDGAYDVWLKAQAELLVNEDRRAKSLDDAAVKIVSRPAPKGRPASKTNSIGSNGDRNRLLADLTHIHTGEPMQARPFDLF
jgi:hypothetical protein